MGIARYSPLFYGYYGNAEVIGQGYRLPLAYMVTTLLAFAYSFIAVLQKMASNARQSRMSNKDEEFVFTWKLFTDWDFMVGNTETATTKHASIITTFKEAIMEEQEKAREGNKYVLITVRVLANVIIAVLLGLSTYVIQVCVDRSRRLDLVKQANKSYDAGFWAENELTIVLTLITTVFPAIVDIVAVAEKYHPRTNLRMQLARIFLLNLLNMYTFFIALYYKQNDLKSSSTSSASLASQFTNTSCDGTTEAANTSIMAIATTVTVPYMEATVGGGGETVTYGNMTVCPTPATTTANGSSFCWETMIGQEVVKLTVMDTVTMVVQIIIAEIFRSYFIKYCNNICCWDLEKTFPEYPDFKTAENLLALITNQGMIWLGLFFSPGLTLLNLLKLLLLMYVRCWATLVSNVPEERIFRASRSNNFYFALLLVMLFLCMLPPLFAIVTIEPSPRCGPFSGYQKSYYVLTRTMETLLPASINSALQYAASPGVIIPVFMLLGMTIYYLVSTSRSLREANNELKMMLEYERTEGRRKVYAMADAKQGIATTGKESGGNTSKFASTASSVLKMAQMAKIITNMTPGQKNSKSAKGDASRHKVAPAVRPKPQVPVAVVHGKRSLKRVAAAAAISKFQHRAPQEPERVVQRRLPERSQAVPSGVRRPAVVSLDNDDGSGDEDMSVYSCVSSDNSGEFIDDPTAAVDASGHLRPVEEDDVFLATQSSISEDEQQEQGTDDINDDHNDEVERTEGTRSKTKAKLKSGLLLSAATLSSRTNSQQDTQLAPSSVKGTARRWSRHKVQPKSLPNITVVDFGEEDSRLRLAEVDLEQPDVTNDQRYVEPVVVVENESDTTSSARTKRPDLAAAGRKSRILTRAAAKTTKGSRGDIPVVSGGKKLSNVVSAMKGEASSHTAPEDTSKDTDRQSSKRKFASALARFQSIEQTT